MPNTIAYTNPHSGAIRGVVGSDRHGSWYGTVWVEGGELGMSNTFDSEADAEGWVVTTLNARANQAWQEYTEQNAECMPEFTQEAFEEGWEAGYKTAVEEIALALEERRPQIPVSADPKRREHVVQRSTLNQAARVAREIGGRS